uniref:Uncharacterized protein n=1 Tax=Pyramimonas obovata TaxID=1411642 RepID=A0A7S0RBG2_9CHLO|mmetsp:Transcript_30375/g.66368  ORF Transcript_30375/g.66368 Transcript_30375/m.66368 type:complete len:327 (+) Transcript_30375:200-1180(+)
MFRRTSLRRSWILLTLLALACDEVRCQDIGPAQLNILQKVRPADVKMQPYPHLVIKEALPWDVYNKLEAVYPSDQTIVSIAQGSSKPPEQNKRYDIKGANALANENQIDPLWVAFVKYHTSPAFYKEVLRVFGHALQVSRPDFARPGRNLTALTTKLRHTEDEKTHVAIDCSIGINTPVKQRSTVRGPHHDDIMELWAGLLYLKNEKDTSTGGDLQVMKCKNARAPCKELSEHAHKVKKVPSNQQYWHGHMDVVTTAGYAKNTLVWFINSQKAVHSVTNRVPTPYSRRLVNFIGQKVMLDEHGHVIQKKGNLLKVVQNKVASSHGR